MLTRKLMVDMVVKALRDSNANLHKSPKPSVQVHDTVSGIQCAHVYVRSCVLETKRASDSCDI